MPVYRAKPVGIEQSANDMIRFFGADAERVALDCARKYDRANDSESREIWAAIADAIRLTGQKRNAANAAE